MNTDNLQLSLGLQSGPKMVNSTSKILIWATQISGVVIVILTLIYIFEYGGGFGGRSDPNHEYYWHVIFMMLGFTFCFGNSLLTFRLFPNYPKPTLKLIHWVINLSVLLCAILGLIFIADMKNLTGRSHYQTIHSWVGIFTIASLFVQFIVGTYAYFYTNAPQKFKECLMPWHIKIGIALFLLGILTIFTAMPYGSTTPQMLLINFTGCLIIIFCFLVLHLLNDGRLKYGRSS